MYRWLQVLFNKMSEKNADVDKRKMDSTIKSSSVARRQASSATDFDDSHDYSKPAIQYHDVTAAAYRIRKGVKETPLEVSLQTKHY